MEVGALEAPFPATEEAGSGRQKKQDLPCDRRSRISSSYKDHLKLLLSDSQKVHDYNKEVFPSDL
jgi:hypothetical protein